MGHKKVWFGLLTALISAVAIWFLRQLPASPYDEAIDWKELYRETFHVQAADMEAAQRKRRDDQTN